MIVFLTVPSLAAIGRMTASRKPPSIGQDAPQLEPAVERDESGRVNIKLSRNVRVTVGNRTTGRITITGWDRDTIEAKAVSELGIEYVRASVSTDAAGANVFLKADYAAENMLMARRAEAQARRQESFARRQEIVGDSQKEQDGNRGERAVGQTGESANASPSVVSPTASPTPGLPQPTPITPADQAPEAPFVFGFRPREVHLEVNLPRHAEIELIKVYRSDVKVTGVDTHIVVSGDRSTIHLSRVGAAEVRTNSGPVEIESVKGLIDVITASGAIRVSDAGGDVRLLSISGNIEVGCARGRVNVGNTNGPVNLIGIGGDVDVTTVDGEIHFAGAIRKDGTYHLKSMSGPVEMSVRHDPAGFTAVLSSYRGTVATDFSMKIIQSTQTDPVNHRLTGRYGNGQTRVTLDSFDGDVRLSKAAPGMIKDCP